LPAVHTAGQARAAGRAERARPEQRRAAKEP